MTRLRRFLDDRPASGYLLLAALYCFGHLKNAFLVEAYPSLIFPLNSIYIATRLMFSNGAISINPAGASTIPILSNVAYAYPPGLYALIVALGLTSVGRIFAFLVLVEGLVPLLLYRLLQTVTHRALALAYAAFAVFYCVNTAWWSPDFVIQPLLIALVLILLSSRHKLERVALAGFLTSLVMLLKHNEGIFTGIMCGSFLFAGSLRESGGRGRPWLWLVLGLHFLFFPVFLRQTAHLDSAVFYLLPYALLWGGVAAWVWRREGVGLDAAGFLREAGVFSLAALLLPLLVFHRFGQVLGHGRYFAMLFSLGMEKKGIWERGIAGVIRMSTAGRHGFSGAWFSAVLALLFWTPFLANLFALWRLRETRTDFLERLRMAALGVMGAFVLYPLEGYHILETKLFLSFVALFYFLGTLPERRRRATETALALLLLAPAAKAVARGYRPYRGPTALGGPDLRERVGVKVPAELARELDRQVETLRRAAPGPYYVIDSSGETLVSLAAIVDNGFPQYYVEMRLNAMDDRVADAVIAGLETTPYAVVNAADVERFEAGVRRDPPFDRVMAFVEKRFAAKERYDAPRPSSGVLAQVTSFVVFAKKR